MWLMAKANGVHRIAELAKVSIGTVDRALHGRSGIHADTRDRVLRVAAKLGYQPNPAAQALSKRRSKLRIGICVPREIHYFYDQLWEGLHAEARRYEVYGIEFVEHPLPELGAGEAAGMRELLRRGVNGIILTPGVPAAVTPLISRAEGNGVRVLCVSTDAPASARSAVVCVEPAIGGQLAGELMARFVPARAQAAVVTGMLRTVDHARKCAGFTDAFTRLCPGGRVAEVIEAHEDQAECARKLDALLDRVPDLAGIYVNTVNCLPVCRVLGARKLTGRIALITTDLFAEMAPYFERGAIHASIYQQPYQQGRAAVAALCEHLLHRRPFENLELNPTIVLRSNLHLFRELRPAAAKAPSRRTPPARTAAAKAR